MLSESRIPIFSEVDIVAARQQGRNFAAQLEFSTIDQTLIATAISEVARNIITFAKFGEIELSMVCEGGREGLLIIARDDGPGIPDIELAMKDGYSTAKTLGLGLPGAKRIVDDFEIVSETGKGTTVKMKKWKT